MPSIENPNDLKGKIEHLDQDTEARTEVAKLQGLFDKVRAVELSTTSYVDESGNIKSDIIEILPDVGITEEQIHEIAAQKNPSGDRRFSLNHAVLFALSDRMHQLVKDLREGKLRYEGGKEELVTEVLQRNEAIQKVDEIADQLMTIGKFPIWGSEKVLVGNFMSLISDIVEGEPRYKLNSANIKEYPISVQEAVIGALVKRLAERFEAMGEKVDTSPLIEKLIEMLRLDNDVEGFAVRGPSEKDISNIGERFSTGVRSSVDNRLNLLPTW